VRLEELVRRAARRTPDAPAVTGPTGLLSYAELDAEAQRLADLLRDRGVRAGDRVLLFGPKSGGFVAAMQACLRAGAVYVPVDVSTPGSWARVIAEDSGASLAFVGDTVAEELDGLVEVIPFATAAERTLAGAAEPLELLGSVDDPAYILYTSGSTGRPKGVCISHRNAMEFVEWAACELGLGPGDQLSNHASLSFDLSVLDLYGAFHAGATVHLVPDGLTYSPASLCQFVHDRHITVWYSVPSVLTLMIRQGGLLDSPAPPALRAVLVAGEPCPVTTLRALAGWTGARLLNLYGPTETNVCTFHEIGPADLLEPGSPPIGQACSGDEVRVLDPEGCVAKAGEEGELVVEGPTVMLGYWGRERHQGPYRTGDLVRVRPDGLLSYLGRLDHMVKLRGYRVELGDVEAVMATHPKIEEVVATDENNGPDARLVVYVVPSDGHRMSLLSVKAHCASSLPRYMVPDQVRHIRAIPRTPNGKVNRSELCRGDPT
jgi:clorobiocin biosynthesis protein CloN4